MSNLLTLSRLRTWRDGRRRHRLTYIDGWRPRREDEAISCERLVREGLEGRWTAQQGQRLHDAVVHPHLFGSSPPPRPSAHGAWLRWRGARRRSTRTPG